MDDDSGLWTTPKSRLLDGIERWLRRIAIAIFAFMFCVLIVPLLLFAVDWRDVVKAWRNADAEVWWMFVGALGVLIGAVATKMMLKHLVKDGLGGLGAFLRPKAVRSHVWMRLYISASAILGGSIGWGMAGDLASPWASALYTVLFAAVLGGLAYSTNRQDQAKAESECNADDQESKRS